MIFISTHLPSMMVPEAGQKICHKHLQENCRKAEVSLISFFNEKESKYLEKTNFSNCKSVELIKIYNKNRAINLIRNFFLPVEIAVRADHRLTRCINKKIKDSNGKDLEFFIEYAQAAFFIPKIKSPQKHKYTVVFHDIISQSIARRLHNGSRNPLMRLYYLAQLKLTRAWERRLSKLIDTAVVLNTKDQELLQELGFKKEQIIIDYPEVSETFRNVSRKNITPFTIIFWGAMNRAENEDAVLWFTSEIFPAIKEKLPQAKLYIVGANPSDKVISLKSEAIEVTGFVEDPIPYFESAAVAIAPLRQGAGVKLKVLEAIAAKIPVVGTSVAAEGVIASKNELHVADFAYEFSELVCTLLAGQPNDQQ